MLLWKSKFFWESLRCISPEVQNRRHWSKLRPRRWKSIFKPRTECLRQNWIPLNQYQPKYSKPTKIESATTSFFETLKLTQVVKWSTQRQESARTEWFKESRQSVETDRHLLTLEGSFPSDILHNSNFSILRVLCLDVMLRRSFPLGSALASALLSGTRFPFRVGIPNSIQSSKVPKEEDFENFICWACNSLAGPGTLWFVTMSGRMLNFLRVLVQFSWFVPHISIGNPKVSTHFTRRIIFQWSRGNEHWGFVKKKIWKHCRQTLWKSRFRCFIKSYCKELGH